MDVTLIPGFNPGPYTGAGSNTYLLMGREPALIDAATGDSRHLDAVANGLRGGSLRRVIVTHGHSDHVAGSEAIARRWPGVEFLKMPWPERDARYDVRWRPLAHDDRLPAGDVGLRVVHTPGHAPDHVCLYEEDSRTLFCGDLVIEGRTVVIPASQGGSLSSYLESLERVRRLGAAKVLPGHGPEIDDLDAVIHAYIEHRQRREDQILTLLRRGPYSQRELVDEIYTSLPSALRGPAGESVLAHLVKLRNEGRVRERGLAWELTPRQDGGAAHS